MNKSKFLKKSLAALLAVMLVVAMIPLSAAAAYEPTVEVIPASGFSGTVSGSGFKWHIDFDYVSNGIPQISVKTGKNTDQISQIKDDGSQTTFAPANSSGTLATVTAELDKDGNRLPIVFVIRDNTDDTQISAPYEVTWTVKETPDAVSVKSAKLDSYNGVWSDSAKTITFTVPFGYAGNKKVNITMNGVVAQKAADQVFTSAGTGITAGTIETNTTKGVPAKWTWEAADKGSDVTYEVSVVEEKALTSIKLGDYVGEIKKASSGANAGYDTGKIEIAVPADIAVDGNGKIMLLPTFNVGSDYTAVYFGANGSTSDDLVKEGEKFDFASLVDGTTEKKLTFYSTGTNHISYDVKFKKNDTDTTLTGVKASKGTGASGASYADVEGTVDATAKTISIVVPKGADLTKVNLTFTGPKSVASSHAGISIANGDGAGTAKTGAGTTTGTFAVITDVNVTATRRVTVTAADSTTQDWYDLTVTEAETNEAKPTITAAKLVMNKGKDNEYTNNGVVDTPNKTITFTVPHSTLDNAVQPSTTDPIVEYTFAKSQSSTIVTSALTSATIPGGSTVTVKAGGGDELTYTIKYVRATAQTGKSISNFVLTSASNKYEIDYNNNKKFSVTATSDGKFKVTTDVQPNSTYYADFVLSEGAKMYKVPASAATRVTSSDAVALGNSDTGVIASTLDVGNSTTGKSFFIASEELAAMIDNNDSKVASYTQIKNKYASLMTEYTFDITVAPRTGNRLGATLSADDGKVTGKVTNGNEITLTVPFSYALANSNNANVDKIFFLDFETDEGAKLQLGKMDDTTWYDLVSGGSVSYSSDKKKLVADDSAWTGNIAFKVVRNAGDTAYELWVGDKTLTSSNAWKAVRMVGQTTNTGHPLRVLAEDGTNKLYYIKEIKVADAKTEASITEATVNGIKATVNESAETITANVPFGTNLGQIKLALTASEMATVKVWNGSAYVAFDADKTYDLRSPLKIEVTSEDGKKTTVYTLTVNMGDQFSDVPAGAWFAPYVKEAFEKGIIQGRGDGTFGPGANITRQDFAVMTVNMLKERGVKIDENATVPFADASSVSSYAKAAVAYCAQEGIIGGYGDGTFKPTRTITREEAAKILAVALDLEVTGTPTFADTNRMSSWAKPYAAAVQKAGIFNGDEANRFNGTANIIRAEAAKVMVDSLKVK